MTGAFYHSRSPPNALKFAPSCEEVAIPNKLVVGVLGLRNSGKSQTWNALFGRNVRTGLHWLPLGAGEEVEVFLIAGSPEERKEHVKDILKNQTCPIVLCS